MNAQWKARAAGKHGAGENNRNANTVLGAFPRCNLYEIRVVHQLPSGCPFHDSNPLAAIEEVQNRGGGNLGRTVDQDLGGLDDLAEAEVCLDCVTRLLTHQRIRALRHLHARQNATPVPRSARNETPDRAPSRVQVPRIVRRALRRRGSQYAR